MQISDIQKVIWPFQDTEAVSILLANGHKIEKFAVVQASDRFYSVVESDTVMTVGTFRHLPSAASLMLPLVNGNTIVDFKLVRINQEFILVHTLKRATCELCDSKVLPPLLGSSSRRCAKCTSVYRLKAKQGDEVVYWSNRLQGWTTQSRATLFTSLADSSIPQCPLGGELERCA